MMPEDRLVLLAIFGGLNVVCSGDFWQLAPPEGGFMGDIPFEFIQRSRQYRPSPSIAHGQALFWGGFEGGIQGVTELEECERCDDEWLREVQQQFREGRLSEDNHNFLHSKPTSVPGSWLGDKTTCRNMDCAKLVDNSNKRGRSDTKKITS